ncbi:YIP1 family protein [Ferrimonas senticii]|uniref:YIP1 family protein n=1 Tax=Ferrimonas senticii TaxID=394566 RepID=UPI00040E3C2C|nr:YIP1 family protein [Ferrimonas senticii]
MEPADQTETESAPVGYSQFPKQAYLAMMVEPRKTIRAIIDSATPRRGFWLLLVLVLLASVLGESLNGELVGLGIAEVLGVAFGLLIAVPLMYGLMYLSAWVTRLVGRWFGGDGELRQLVTGYVWAQVPVVGSLLLTLVLLLMYGGELFTDPNAVSNGAGWKAVVMMIIGLLQLLFAGWALVLSVAATAEVLGLSIGRCILVMLVTMLLFLAPIILLALAAGWFA